MSCAPPGPTGDACESLAVPASPDDGPRHIFGDTLGFGPVTVAEGVIYYTHGEPHSSDQLCRLSTGGGASLCFASIEPNRFLDLHVDGGWLTFSAPGADDRGLIGRVGRERGEVEYRRIVEKKEWLNSLDVAKGAVCALIGRPGPGYAETGVVVVPKESGPRTMLVPFGQAHGEAIACDDESVYFLGTSGLMRVPVRGGAAVAIGGPWAYRIALGPDYVYTASPGSIDRLSKGDGGVTEQVAPIGRSDLGWNTVEELRAVAGGVAWREEALSNNARSPKKNAIRRCRAREGCDTLVEGDDEIRFVAESDGVFYWVRKVQGGRFGSTFALFAARGPATLAVAGD